MLLRNPFAPVAVILFVFFFNDTATTEIYTLSLHDALPISIRALRPERPPDAGDPRWVDRDRKSTRLNSSHITISYAVFCLKKKKNSTYYRHEPPGIVSALASLSRVGR